ncbi:Bgt-20238, partial [Blumeria graminis f. sp. tritici]
TNHREKREALWLSKCAFVIPQILYHRERVWCVGIPGFDAAFSSLVWDRCSSYPESTSQNSPDGALMHHPALSRSIWAGVPSSDMG